MQQLSRAAERVVVLLSAGLKQTNSLRADRKEVEGPLCSEGTRNSLDYEAQGRGSPNPQCKPTQVSGG